MLRPGKINAALRNNGTEMTGERLVRRGWGKPRIP